MEATPTTPHLTLDDFVRLYEAEGPFEIIDGERIARMPPVAIHVYVANLLMFTLRQFCNAHHLGVVFSEAPFVLTYDANWVKGARVPDVMFYRAARWQRYIADTPDWKHKPFVLVPDLVVEVVSTHDRYTDLQSKIEHYLDDGVQRVWVIDPNRQRGGVYVGQHYQALGLDEAFDGGDLLPGLAVPLRDLFAD